MSQLIEDCPRCKSAKVTFDLLSQNNLTIRHGWQLQAEVFCACRHCSRASIFIVNQKLDASRDARAKEPLSKLTVTVNNLFSVDGYISLKDSIGSEPPEYLPTAIDAAFREGASCLAIGCTNAAATMFRLSVDHATREKLPSDNSTGLNSATRHSLGLRMKWLFDNGYLPADLRELSTCIKEDGNDGAHAGTLSKEDAEDLLDFSTALLERLYTEPKRIQLAKERREVRRSPKSA